MVRINYNKVARDLKVLESTVATPLITGILAVLTIFYASSVSERLPTGFRDLVNNVFVQIGFLGLVMFLQTSNPMWALALVGGTFLALFLSYIFRPAPGPKLITGAANEIEQLRSQLVNLDNVSENSSDLENANQLKAELEALIQARDGYANANATANLDANSGAQNFLSGLIKGLRGGTCNVTNPASCVDRPSVNAYNTGLKNVDVDLSLLNPPFSVCQSNNQAHTATPHADTRPSLVPLVLRGARAKWAERLNPPLANEANSKGYYLSGSSLVSEGFTYNCGKDNANAGDSCADYGYDLNSEKKNNVGNGDDLVDKILKFTSNDLNIQNAGSALQFGGQMLGCIADSCGVPGMNTSATEPPQQVCYPSTSQYCRDDPRTAIDNIIQNNVSVLINLLIAELKLNFTQEEIRVRLCGVLQIILRNCNKTLKEFFEDPEARRAFFSLLSLVNEKVGDSQSLAIIYELLNLVAREMKHIIAEKLNNAITNRQTSISDTLRAACNRQVNLNQICGFSSLAQTAEQASVPRPLQIPTNSETVTPAQNTTRINSTVSA